MSPDIIDRIDELIDEQLAAGEPENGWDYHDPDYPKCPHCDRDWHGLPINRWGYDAVMCEGATFIGPMQDPWGLRPRRDIEIRIVVNHQEFRMLHEYRERIEYLNAILVWPEWRIPDNPFDTSQWWTQPELECPGELPDITITFGPQNWACELRIQPEAQLPDPVLPRAAWDRCSPLGELVSAHWDEFSDDSPALPTFTGFDFTGYDLDPVHGVFAQSGRRGRR